jgi:hypothetical protein
VAAGQDEDRFASIAWTLNVGRRPMLAFVNLPINGFYHRRELRGVLEEIAQKSGLGLSAPTTIAAQIEDEGIRSIHQLHDRRKDSAGIPVRRKIRKVDVADITGETPSTPDTKAAREVEGKGVLLLFRSRIFLDSQLFIEHDSQMLIVAHGSHVRSQASG